MKTPTESIESPGNNANEPESITNDMEVTDKVTKFEIITEQSQIIIETTKKSDSNKKCTTETIDADENNSNESENLIVAYETNKENATLPNCNEISLAHRKYYIENNQQKFESITEQLLVIDDTITETKTLQSDLKEKSPAKINTPNENDLEKFEPLPIINVAFQKNYKHLSSNNKWSTKSKDLLKNNQQKSFVVLKQFPILHKVKKNAKPKQLFNQLKVKIISGKTFEK